jgi:hypothetical protein
VMVKILQVKQQIKARCQFAYITARIPLSIRTPYLPSLPKEQNVKLRH